MSRKAFGICSRHSSDFGNQNVTMLANEPVVDRAVGPERSILQRGEQFVGTQLEDSFVILSLEAAQYFAFNTTANSIWDLLEEPRTCGQIVDALMRRYEVSEQDCTRSVARVIDELRANGLVRESH